MKSWLQTGAIGWALLLLSACASNPHEGIDTKRAADANSQLGLAYMMQGNYEQAQDKLHKALEFEPKDPNSHHYLAELYRRLNQPVKAREEYELSLEYAPSNSSFQNNYGVFLCERGEYAKADTYFKSALNNPFYTAKDAAYENMGLCALTRGNIKQAEVYFKQALGVNPRLPKTLLNMAQIEFDRSNIKSSYKYYQQFIYVAPQTAQSLWLGILLERGRGDKGKAASYAMLLRDKFPGARETELLQKLEKQGKL